MTPSPSLSTLTLIFLRIGNLTFGGGDPTMAALERELVERRGWLTQDRYGLAYALARITPGTNMMAFCAAAAWFLSGWPGAVLAVLAVTLPSAALVVWLTHVYEATKGNALAHAAIGGMLASAVGMMLAAAWNLLRPHLRRRKIIRALALATGGFLLTFKGALPPIQVLALAAAVGLLWREDE